MFYEQAGEDPPSLPIEVIQALQGELPNSLSASDFATPESLASIQPNDNDSSIKDDISEGLSETNSGNVKPMAESPEIVVDRKPIETVNEPKVKKPVRL